MFQCSPEPTPPTLNEETRDSQIGLFIKDVAYAGRDCRDQLSEIGEFLNMQPGIEVTDVVVRAQTKRKRRWPWG